MAVLPPLGFSPDPGEDAEAAEQSLRPADQLFTDHVHADNRRPLPSRDVAIGLEQAAQVRGHCRQRRGEQALGDHLIDAASPQAPTGHEVVKDVSVQPGTPAVQVVPQGLDPALMAVYAREDRIDGLSHPSELSVGDGQRPVRPFVLPDEPVGLQPTGERGLGNIAGTDLRLAERRPPVPFQGVVDAQLAGRNEPPVALAGAPPHQVVGGHVEGVPGLGADPQHLLGAVAFGGQHRGDAVCVVDLGAHRVVSRQSTDRNQPGRRADQRVERLARGYLLRGLGAHVEPDGRVEREHLMQQHPGQLVLEDLCVLLGGEVPVLDPGGGIGRHHPVDELPQARLAGRPADGPAEVLAGHDVRRVDRPEVGELHPALLEVDGAVTPVGHHHVAALPGHLVVRVHAGGGVEPLQGQPLRAGAGRRGRLRLAGLGRPGRAAAGTVRAVGGPGDPDGLGHVLPSP